MVRHHAETIRPHKRSACADERCIGHHFIIRGKLASGSAGDIEEGGGASVPSSPTNLSNSGSNALAR
jgi:hypothetical protein